MPIYEYRASGDDSCEVCGAGFEVIQKMSDNRLERCPRCHAAVARVISAAAIANPGRSLDKSNLEKHGFTQYKRSGKGIYEKTAGKGPDFITDD